MVDRVAASSVHVQRRQGLSVVECVHIVTGEKGDAELREYGVNIFFEGSITIPVEIAAYVYLL